MRPDIFMLSLASAVSGITMRSVEAMLPELARTFSTSVSAAASVITAFALATGVGQLMHGALGDRYGKLRMVSLVLGGAAFFAAGCALAQTLTQLSVMRFLTGFLNSAPVMLGIAYIADTVPVEERQPVVAQFVSGSVIGQSLGPLIGGVLTDLVGWRATFVVSGILLASISAALWFRTRTLWDQGPRTTGAIISFSRYAALLKLPKVRITLASGLIETIFFFGIFSFAGALMKERFDLSFTVIGLTLTGFGIGGLIFTLTVSPLLRALGQRAFVLYGGLICVCGALVIAFTPVWWLAPPAMVSLGFSYYMLHNTLQIKASEMAPHARGTGMSMFAFSWSIGQSVGAVAMGLGVATIGYTPMIVAFGLGFGMLGVWLYINFKRLP